ncbi:MAG: translation elongation factor 1 alpha-related protein [archaeon]|nr:translation elongation factor 1 alpha-related protein [archaeon]
MGNLNVAVVGATGLADKIGKKGTVTDMTFFEVKDGNDSITLIEPSKYPDKLQSLFYATEMAEFVILVVDKIDSFLGETIVMVDSQRMDKGWIVLRNYIQPEQLTPLIAGTSLENYKFVEEDHIAMRLALVDMAKSEKRVAGDGTCGSCPVDSHFNVKGVGTVVLGSVADGYFKVHDKMTVWPLKKEVILKSIQKHDIDAADGIKGDHVGLALRGIESDELDRGFVCSTDPGIKMSGSFKGKIAYNKYWKNAVKEGMMLHLGHWMQIVPVRVTAAGADKESEVDFAFDGEIIHKSGDKAVLMYYDGGKLRVIGTLILP